VRHALKSLHGCAINENDGGEARSGTLRAFSAGDLFAWSFPWSLATVAPCVSFRRQASRAS